MGLLGKKKVYCITPNTNFLKLKITKLLDNLECDDSNKITNPLETAPLALGSKKSKKTSKVISGNDSSTMMKIEATTNQDLNCNSNNIIEKDDRSTEVSSNLSSNQSVKSDCQLNLTKSKSCNEESIKGNNNVKKSTKKDILHGIQLPTEIEDFLNNTNLLKQIQFQSVRKIGTLTVEERREKIEKYLQKRKKRTWNKKISYDCRKKVADSRLRIKGRFVTKEQAVTILGEDGIFDLDKISSSEIKDLLNLKFGSSIIKKKDSDSPTSKEDIRLKNEYVNEEEEKEKGEESNKTAISMMLIENEIKNETY